MRRKYRPIVAMVTAAAVASWSGCNETIPLLPSSQEAEPALAATQVDDDNRTPVDQTVIALDPDVLIEVATDVYSADGAGNNPQNPDWGSNNVRLIRGAPTAYGDGISSLAGENRPSAREISNALVDQGDEDIINERLLSAMIYAWGQFIDHDIGLTPVGGTEIMQIPVPTGDPSFDPFGTGTQVIMTTRSVYDPSSGTSVDNPREQINVITSWLDASMVYGSDQGRAMELRTLSGGHMKTGPDQLLPLNNAANFPNGTLAMDNDAHVFDDDLMFAAGDVRANENIELTALQTLFVREHNRLADAFAAGGLDATDEELYQMARAVVIAEIQAITYNEWLPAVLGPNALPPYRGYDPAANPGLTNEFSTAAFRFGHSLLGDDVEFLDDQGVPVHEGVSLAESFFNPVLLAETGIDPVLKYLASDPASELDDQIVGSLRNFLFGPPGAGGLDLASLNIQRGRDHGLADYNTARAAYGLPRVTSFGQITTDAAMQQKMEELYGSVDNIDLWIGALGEGHTRDSSVGPTLRTIIGRQFASIRDGDRLWHQRRMSGRLLNIVEKTRLSDVIVHNTSLRNIQPNVFFFKAGISGAVFADSNGDGRPNRGERGVAGVTLQLVNVTDDEVAATGVTNGRGRYRFDVLDGVRTGVYEVRALADDGSDSVLAMSETVMITSGMQLLRRVNIAVPVP